MRATAVASQWLTKQTILSDISSAGTQEQVSRLQGIQQFLEKMVREW